MVGQAGMGRVRGTRDAPVASAKPVLMELVYSRLGHLMPLAESFWTVVVLTEPDLEAALVRDGIDLYLLVYAVVDGIAGV